MASEKTAVVEYLFKKYWDNNTKSLTKSVMSLDDVAEAIRACNAKYSGTLSAKNPANFLKDLLRGVNSSVNWPKFVSDLEFTAVQKTSEGDCFEFIPYEVGQIEPFPNRFKINEDAPVYEVQSISMPLLSKSLGRADETWLIQTAINLRVVETHFSLESDLTIEEMTHLQIGIKLRSTEIDALFLGRLVDGDDVKTLMITCEAKQSRDALIESQIINQVMAVFESTDVDMVVPIGMRPVVGEGIYISEFKCVNRKDKDLLKTLELSCEGLYKLQPPVPGI